MTSSPSLIVRRLSLMREEAAVCFVHLAKSFLKTAKAALEAD